MRAQERDLSRSWDENAGAWAEAVRSGAIESRRVATDAAIVQAVVESGGTRVLDAGCGEGWLARRVAAQGLTVTGIDGSADLIRAAREQGGADFQHLSYEDLHDARNAPGPFDVVVCNFSLLHEDVAATLKLLADRLEATGSLLIQTIHPWTARGEAYADGWREESFVSFGGAFKPMPWFFRTLASWSHAIRSAGLLVTQVEEPVHPASREPLSLLIRAVRQQGYDP